MVNVAFKISERGIEYVKNMVEQITNHLTKKKKNQSGLSAHTLYTNVNSRWIIHLRFKIQLKKF